MCLGNSSHIFFLHQAISGYFPRWLPKKLVGTITYEPLVGLHSKIQNGCSLGISDDLINFQDASINRVSPRKMRKHHGTWRFVFSAAHNLRAPHNSRAAHNLWRTQSGGSGACSLIKFESENLFICILVAYSSNLNPLFVLVKN